MAFALAVNGRRVESEAPPLVPLVDVLRDELGLTGTKLACGEGRCGACSVLIDGELALSCLLPVVHADGRDVTTIEGLAGPEQELTPLQDALLEAGGVQCGACTPGMVVALTALLARAPAPSERHVREWLSGNLCRCTGYHKIVEAALAAAGRGPT